MPIPSHNLEETLRRSVIMANGRLHEYLMVEHLLWALTYDPDAADVLKGCGVDPEELRQDVSGYIDTELKTLVSTDAKEPVRTAAVESTLKRAINRSESAGDEEVTGAHVLVAIFSQRKSDAPYFLEKRNMIQIDAERYIYGKKEARSQRRRDMVDRALGLREAAKKAGLAPIFPTVS